MFFGDLNQNEHERLITAAGIAALVAYFCYEVAYGTNESSYRIGYNTAIANLTNLITVPPPGSTPENGNICDTQDGCPSSDDAQNYCMAIGVGVTNTTACVDGYVNGWKHWCLEPYNAPYCVNLVTGGAFPGSFINDNKRLLADMAMMIGTWNFVNESNMTSAHKITFDGTAFQLTTNGKLTAAGLWATDGHSLQLSCNTECNIEHAAITLPSGGKYVPPTDLIFTTRSDNHIELQDANGDILHLNR